MSATTAIPMSGVPSASLRSCGYVCVLIVLPALCMLAGVLGIEAYLAFAFLMAALVIARRAAIRGPRKASGFLLLFFVCAIGHAAVGFVMAPISSRMIWIGTASAGFYAHSILIIALGILAAAIGYATTVGKDCSRIRRCIASFDAVDSRLICVARGVLVAGAALMLVLYLSIGLIPLLAGNAGQARYLTSQGGDDYIVSEWLIARALDLLMFSLPLVLVSASWRKRRWDWLLVAFGFLALLLPLRRANVLSVLFVVLIMGALRSDKSLLKHGLVAALLVSAYAFSQMMFTNLIGGLGDFEVDDGLSIMGSALPEVRDLGWTIELLNGEHLQGATFAQALVPLPSFVSDFSQRSSLRNITSRLIGLDVERRTGGLRLTLAGEAYLNFDFFGTVAMGFLFGIACALTRVLMSALQDKQAIWAYYVASVAFVWLCFWVYLGGTQAAATVKIGSLLLAISLFAAYRRNTNREVPA